MFAGKPVELVMDVNRYSRKRPTRWEVKCEPEKPGQVELIASFESDPATMSPYNLAGEATTLAIRTDSKVANVLLHWLQKIAVEMDWPPPTEEELQA